MPFLQAQDVFARILGIAGVAASGASVLVALAAFRRSSASTELALRDMIARRAERANDAGMSYMALAAKANRTLEEDQELERRSAYYDVAKENWLNAYEEACAQYLGGSVNRQRFKFMYRPEIRELVEAEHNREAFNPGPLSDYEAILEVYREWNEK